MKRANIKKKLSPSWTKDLIPSHRSKRALHDTRKREEVSYLLRRDKSNKFIKIQCVQRHFQIIVHLKLVCPTPNRRLADYVRAKRICFSTLQLSLSLFAIQNISTK